MSSAGAQVRSACLAALAMFFLAACGGEDAEEMNLISMSPYTYAPSTLTVRADSEVTLRLRNTETFQGEPHTWTLLEAGYRAEAPWTEEDGEHVLVEKLVHPSETETLSFTAPSEPGEYQWVCSITGHLEAGMRGTLVVTP